MKKLLTPLLQVVSQVVSQVVPRAIPTLVSIFALIVAAPALAQDGFQKVDEAKKMADNVPAVPFVGIAYGVIWLAVLVYVLAIARGLGRVNAELDELRRKLDGAGATRK